jgi:hypothetical protein
LGNAIASRIDHTGISRPNLVLCYALLSEATLGSTPSASFATKQNREYVSRLIAIAQVKLKPIHHFSS